MNKKTLEYDGDLFLKLLFVQQNASSMLIYEYS